MKGRKPQPSRLKILRGNPGRRPVNPAEPQHAALDPAVPVELVDAIARAEWIRVAALLAAHGQVTTVDRATLIGYCVKYGQWQALEREAATQSFIVKSPKGYPFPNPALGMANSALALVLKAAAELGITPSSRSRVHLVEHTAPPTSKWAGVLK